VSIPSIVHLGIPYQLPAPILDLLGPQLGLGFWVTILELFPGDDEAERFRERERQRLESEAQKSELSSAPQDGKST
jgi:hypothetical protein